MMWEAWVLVVFMLFSIIGVVTTVGKPREPLSHHDGAVAIIMAMILIWLSMRLGGAF
jgi:hypothetical protein